jgi:hypothetical protein
VELLHVEPVRLAHALISAISLMRFDWGKNWPAIAVFAAAAILIAPLWLTDGPAMPDYPAHLATFYLLSGGAKLPALAQFYRIEWGFIPNLASEILVPAMGRLVGIAAGVKLFLSAAIAMWVIAPAWVHRSLYGRFGIESLAASFFAYNANFMWGFLNYYFAAGLAFVVFAAWIASRARPSLWRLAAFAAAVTVVYFCHVFAAAVLGLLIGAYELGMLIELRDFSREKVLARFGAIAASFMPAAIAFVFLRPSGAPGGRFEFNLADTWQDRIESAMLFHFDRPAYFLLVLLILFLAMGVWRRWVTFHPRMRLLLVALAAFTIFAPEWAMGGWGVDLRLPAILGVFAFTALEIKFGPKTLGALGAAMLGLLAFSAASLAGNWRYYDARFAEFRAASQSIPPGSRIFTVLDGDAIGQASDEPYWHMAEFAIVDRDAFTPLMFTTKGQHVVHLNPPFDDWAASNANQGSPPDISELDDLAAGQVDGDKDIRDVFPYLMRFQCHYNEVVLIHLGGTRSPVPDSLRLRRAGSFFTIYDVAKNENCEGK